ncbi:hypothetical protein [Clostridium sp.]|uniref:hypothetical protein n=1 Tax=Clostridium sp. TaxID=1506 RepID=UPI0026247AA3|nr:hypothetical protein [Clostridium sp.]
MSHFSKISNKLFYKLNDNKEESILKVTKDSKTLLIMHNLYLMTDRKGRAITSIDFLIEELGYKVTKKIQPQIKEILNQLKQLGFIDYEGEIKSYSKIMKINTENLNVNDEFFVVEEDELKIISDASDDIREVNNIIKVYFYLKARCHKRGTELCYTGGQAETTYCSYENISKHTLISEGNIKKYIDILKEINLIDYDNLGKKYKEDNPKLLTDCANIYALIKISGKEFIKDELREGMKQQKFDYEDKGFKITKKDYKNNNRKINGRKGYLIKKQNNNTITEDELMELESIVSSHV